MFGDIVVYDQDGSDDDDDTGEVALMHLDYSLYNNVSQFSKFCDGGKCVCPVDIVGGRCMAGEYCPKNSSR